jgi:hypothetical protein
MRGPVPGIHDFQGIKKVRVDGRDKPGHDTGCGAHTLSAGRPREGRDPELHLLDCPKQANRHYTVAISGRRCLRSNSHPMIETFRRCQPRPFRNAIR